MLEVELGGGGRNFLQKVPPSPSEPPPFLFKDFRLVGRLRVRS
ncbi:hypothetical protein WCP94_000897 [Bilophila wadsworthia]